MQAAEWVEPTLSGSHAADHKFHLASFPHPDGSRGILTARAGGSAAAATAIPRPGGRAEQPRTWLEGVRLQGGNRSLPPTPDRRILSPASPQIPHSRGPTGKRGMEREEREGRGGQAAAEGRRGDWGGGPLVVMGGGREEETGPERTRGAFRPHSCKPQFPAHPPRQPCPPHRELKPLKTSPSPQT